MPILSLISISLPRYFHHICLINMKFPVVRLRRFIHLILQSCLWACYHGLISCISYLLLTRPLTYLLSSSCSHIWKWASVIGDNNGALKGQSYLDLTHHRLVGPQRVASSTRRGLIVCPSSQLHSCSLCQAILRSSPCQMPSQGQQISSLPSGKNS